ncbi:serine/threonine-protein phosphatase 5-like [Octopus sinensis]|uniref:Serine/threonine-protein phosphatase 5-like n=1 Tax=Octopus sinensis TaxID=2607531 RepID=A0A6P7TYU3_9MOLL|nr:serine/threonine-protein phosphatase 5-like [Octopus sinensis]
MNQMYGFEGEVKHKYNSDLMMSFTNLFNNLPLAYLIDQQVFVVHGGLSSTDTTIEDIKNIKRVCQPPDQVMSDLLWSDPQVCEGVGESKRGVGIQFGPDVTKRFLETNQLRYIIRSHEVKEKGYDIEHDSACITIFSAPNYWFVGLVMLVTLWAIWGRILHSHTMISVLSFLLSLLWWE